MTQVIAHPLYSVQSAELGDYTAYDWFTTAGFESDEWYETAEEAEREVRSRLGLNDDLVVLTRVEYDKLLDAQWRYEELNR